MTVSREHHKDCASLLAISWEGSCDCKEITMETLDLPVPLAVGQLEIKLWVLANATPEHRERAYKKILAHDADLRRQLADETAIVDRVWKALGITTYEQAGGKANHELVADLAAKLEASEKRVEELKKSNAWMVEQFTAMRLAVGGADDTMEEAVKRAATLTATLAGVEKEFAEFRQLEQVATLNLLNRMEAKDQRMAELEAGLRKLSNEVLGSLPLMETLARQEFGNTNYTCLIQRAQEARALLAESLQAQAALRDGGT
jgi:hypothetical protein